jgi:spore coat polysaccharide biosynthesis protein SpsF
MTTTCIIQARMGSTRLPGKVLIDVAGRPMLELMLLRLAALRVDALVVATTTHPHDDRIVELCTRINVPTHRGPEDDVLARFIGAVEANPGDDIVRLTADCPLSDPAVVEDVLARHVRTRADYTSNTLLRSYPDGLDVEVVRAETLRRAGDCAVDPVEREHVTPWAYRHPEWHQLGAQLSGEDAGDERWTVDTAADIETVRAIVAVSDDPLTAGWQDMLGTFGRRAPRSPDHLRLRPAAVSDSANLLRWRNDPVTARFSETPSAVGSATHATWLAARLDRPATRIWIACLGEQPVGQVRIDVAAAEGQVSLGLDPKWRGRGLGTELVRQLIKSVGDDLQVVRLRAAVKRDNEPSRRAFAACGFVADGGRGDFDLYVWERYPSTMSADAV